MRLPDSQLPLARSAGGEHGPGGVVNETWYVATPPASAAAPARHPGIVLVEQPASAERIAVVRRPGCHPRHRLEEPDLAPDTRRRPVNAADLLRGDGHRAAAGDQSTTAGSSCMTLERQIS